MSSTTPNIGLVLPVGSERVSRQIINENNTKIDTAIGALNSKLFNYPSSNTDFNDCTSSGIYLFAWNASGQYVYHRPANSACILIVGEINSNAFQQVCITYDTPSQIFARVKTNGTWTSWEGFAHKKYAESYVIEFTAKDTAGAGIEDVADMPAGFTMNNSTIDLEYYQYGHAYGTAAGVKDIQFMPLMNGTKVRIQYFSGYNAPTFDKKCKIILRRYE